MTKPYAPENQIWVGRTQPHIHELRELIFSGVKWPQLDAHKRHYLVPKYRMYGVPCAHLLYVFKAWCWEYRKLSFYVLLHYELSSSPLQVYLSLVSLVYLYSLCAHICKIYNV